MHKNPPNFLPKYFRNNDFSGSIQYQKDFCNFFMNQTQNICTKIRQIFCRNISKTAKKSATCQTQILAHLATLAPGDVSVRRTSCSNKRTRTLQIRLRMNTVVRMCPCCFYLLVVTSSHSCSEVVAFVFRIDRVLCFLHQCVEPQVQILISGGEDEVDRCVLLRSSKWR